jgi:hypothetical protein
MTYIYILKIHIIRQSTIYISILKDIIDAHITTSHESSIRKIYLSLLSKDNRVYLKIILGINHPNHEINYTFIPQIFCLS